MVLKPLHIVTQNTLSRKCSVQLNELSLGEYSGNQGQHKEIEHGKKCLIFNYIPQNSSSILPPQIPRN